jgi:hypothetical protein
MAPQVHATEEVACCLSSSTYLLCTTTPTNRPRAGRSSTIAPLMFGEWEESMTWMEHLASLGTVSYGPNCHSLIANIKNIYIPTGKRGGADEQARLLRWANAAARTIEHGYSVGRTWRCRWASTVPPATECMTLADPTSARSTGEQTQRDTMKSKLAGGCTYHITLPRRAGT